MDNSVSRQQVHELIEQLGPSQIEAVRHLLEVMVEADDEPLTTRDREAITASRDYFERNPKPGVSFEEFAAECGFTMNQIRDSAD